MASLPVLNRTRPAHAALAGFTLVEMIVVLAIIGIISGVVITGQSAYNQSLLLTDTTYTVAYSIRQAQSLGLSSRTARRRKREALEALRDALIAEHDALGDG